MKTNYIKTNIALAAIILTSFTVTAQTSIQEKATYDADRYGNSYVNTRQDGKNIEVVDTHWHDKYYEIKMVDGKMTSLSVDGEKIPSANWGKYTEVIAEIKEQIKRDKEQAQRDQAQGKLDQEQASRDQIQAKRDMEQAAKDQEQAKKEEEQAANDQVQAKRDQEQADRDREQAKKRPGAGGKGPGTSET